MSEHQISKNAYGMELHMVHANAAGELAVVGVFIDTSSNSSSHENAFLKTIWPGLATPAARAAGGASQTLTVNPAKHNGESVVIKAIKLLISICIPVYAVSIYVIFYVSI
jgi:carbonic anhydrase